MFLVVDSAYRPVNIVGFKKAAKLLYKNKAIMLLEPDVIQLNNFVFSFSRPVKCNKYNIALRDENTCQYCGRVCGKASRTVDHVVPTSIGGQNSFENCVLACKRCNNNKGDKTLKQAGLKLLKKPKSLTWEDLLSLKAGNIFNRFKEWLTSACNVAA
jgi:5-methylcytosine-specific restriction endonuclease McrA